MTTWTSICLLDDLLPLRGVAALVDGEPVAVVRVGDEIHAVGNVDPFTGVSVLSRGLVVERDDAVALLSPLHKQAFELTTGRCLHDPAVAIPVHEVELHDGWVMVRLARRTTGVVDPTRQRHRAGGAATTGAVA